MANDNGYINIDSVDSIGESDYLKIDFRSVENKLENPQFTEALGRLWDAGRAIEKIIEDGLTERIGNIHTYYYEAVKWLKGQDQTTNFVSLPPFGSNEGEMPNHAQQFIDTWMREFSNHFFGNSVTVAYFASTKELDKNRVFNSAKSKFNTYVSSAKAEIEQLTQSEINKITQAKGLEEWQSYYDRLIRTTFDEKDTDKNNPKSTFASELLSKVSFPFNIIFIPFVLILKILKKPIRYLSQNILEARENYYFQMKHYKLWKNIWLILFVLFGIADIVLSTFVFNWTLKDNLAEILALKIIAVVFFGTLYVTSNKNYRIYANLYDQTLFRSIVSKTVQGIILLDETKIGSGYKNILLTVAAQSMFEMKPNGHLTKKEAASPVSDLLATILSRQQ
ncbi:TPA: hypothetical protein DIS56_04415 [Candidatus Saccharibacteria bacterium]|nr:MAG: hypothetical protein UX30_C0005G0071 [Candidatus Saccharibacteria bacterium GW2011_GWA2_46_10]OGL34924.1 MAG: hypothetical protein A3F05_02235 [Candidatus Saccharibacteria bacterium RIFCSPHIGHO2_12_FULL_47_17]HCM52336.1 hypothetical protein [Candidatus Saccharibacteria bacterium]